MKTKPFILLLISTLTTTAFAQLEKQEAKYEWSISAAINSVDAQMDQMLFDTWVYPSANYYAYYGDKQDKSISLSIIPKYQIADDLFLRFEFGVTNIDLESHYNGFGDTTTQNQGYGIGGTGNIIKDDIIQQKIYRYAAGIQWNFMKKKFIETYCGASLNYFHYSQMYWSDYITNNAPLDRTLHYTATTPGGFSTGIGILTGFSIYLHKQVSFGGEFSYSLLYYKLGGVQSGVTEGFYPNIPTSVLYWKIYNNASEGIQFSKVMPSINLTIRF